MENILIIAVREHRKWGAILTPYLAESIKDQSFLTIKEVVNYNELEKYDFFFSEKEKKIIKILDSYSDKHLLRLFDKKSNSLQDFFLSVEEKKIKTVIRPFIENKIGEVIPIMHELRNEGNLNVYYKKDDLRTLHPNDKIELLAEKSQAVFYFEKVESGMQYFLSIKTSEGELKLSKCNGVGLVNNPCIILVNNRLAWFEDIDAKKLKIFFSNDFMFYSNNLLPSIFEGFIFNAVKNNEVNAKGFDIREHHSKPEIHMALVADIYNRILFEISYMYGDIQFKYGDKRKFEAQIKNENGVYSYDKICRNDEIEAKIINEFNKLELTHVAGSMFGVVDKDLKSHYHAVSWLNVNSDFLEKNGIIVNPELSGKRYFTQDINLNVGLTENQDWFDIYGTVKFGSFEIPFVKLRNCIVKGIKEFKLPNNEVVVLPDEWFTEYHEMMLMGSESGGTLKLRKHHFNAISSKVEGVDQTHINNLRKLTQTELQHVPAPEGLQATLRNYQHTGFSWMSHLRTLGFGGCLADDMGLGKTLQTLTVLLHAITPRYDIPVNEDDIFDDGTGGVAIQLDMFGKPMEASIKEQTKKTKKTNYSPASLIVMPVSLIHNWENEIKKFTPQLSVYKYVGAARTKSTLKLDSYDIVLTSYGIVRNDTAFLKKYNFYYLILDESQYIKNPNSKIYQAVNQLTAQNKLVLTGTPIENSLMDLWTQLNFLNKGMLGNLNFFRNEFINPIERNRDEKKQKKLQTLIQPFLLRRTKGEVAKDLPALTEQVVYCNMTDDQRSYYEEEKSKVRNKIFESIETTGIEKSSMIVLQGLTRMRQIANHPSMMDDMYTSDSGKYDLVFDHIDNLIAENHKVLIYSSFVKHLQLFEKQFKERNLMYVKLTGETKDRKYVVEKFQDDPETQLFLISLKAGGVGLNLTAADYVFLLDPWWNPAAENQAINRAHRIGQNKNVFVYRFISKDSIEEKIIKLQEKKSALAELFINSNNPFKSLSLENLEHLFE